MNRPRLARLFLYAGLRLIARITPAPLGCAALAPFAIICAAVAWPRAATTRAALIARLPALLRGRTGRGTALADHFRAYTNRGAWMFREWYWLPRWRRRVAWRGLEHLDSARRPGRGVLLATVHFGALTSLPRLLCARGWPVGVLVDDPAWISRRARRGPGGRRNAPRIFRPDQLRRLHRFLDRGGILLVAIDFPRGRLQTIQIGDRNIAISSGALRLAEARDAALLPCVAMERWWWRWVVQFGEPMPRSALHAGGEAAAYESLTGQMLTMIAQSPDQCGELLLRRFEPLGT